MDGRGPYGVTERGVRAAARHDLLPRQTAPTSTILLLMNGLGLVGTLGASISSLSTLRTLLGQRSNPGHLDPMATLYERDGAPQPQQAVLRRVEYSLSYLGPDGRAQLPWLFVDAATPFNDAAEGNGRLLRQFSGRRRQRPVPGCASCRWKLVTRPGATQLGRVVGSLPNHTAP
jgi:hypothetical protein